MTILKTLIDNNVSTFANSIVSDSFIPATGSLLVLCASGIPNGNGPTSVTISGGGLTWTEREFTQYSSSIYGGWIGIWTAPVTAGSSMTTTVSCGGESQENISFAVYEISGYDSIGDSFSQYQVGNLTPNNLTGSYSGTLSPSPSASSVLIAHCFGNGDSGVSESSVTPNANWSYSLMNPQPSTSHCTMSRTGQSSESVVVDDITCNFVRALAAIEIKSSLIPERIINIIQY